MRSNDSLESMLRKLRYRTTADRRRRTLENLFQAMDEMHERAPAARRLGIGRRFMNTRTTKMLLAAAVIMMVLGGVAFWPFGAGGKNQWWLAPPAAWGRELLTTLGTIQAVSCRERTLWVTASGAEHPSSTWDIFYVSKDSYRRDIYDDEVLRETQWYVPDGNDMLQHYVRYDQGCYGALRHRGSFGMDDPVERMRFYVGLLDEADRRLGEQVIAGRNCVGFEIRASKYGSNPETWVDRIWFDTETRLPMQIEQAGRPVTGDPTSTFTKVMDQFRYGAQLPADTFIPQAPPQGFINAHPDELQKAREREEKGEMPAAEVPAELKSNLFAAFREAQTVAYTEGDTHCHVSRNAWRAEQREGERVRRTTWFVVQKNDDALKNFDSEDQSVRLVETTVDYDARTWQRVEYNKDKRPAHPLDLIAFLIGHIDLADRRLEDAVIGGVNCFGFDLSAKKYVRGKCAGSGTV
jgi:hypothetical protein